MKHKMSLLLNSAAKVINNIKKTYRFGIRSNELISCVYETLNSQLSTYDTKLDFLVGKDTLKIDGISDNCTFKKKDTVILDLSIGSGGIWCDICRTFFVGTPTTEQIKVYKMLISSMKRSEGFLFAGSKANDIYNAANAVFKENNSVLVHHAGHRIGDEAYMLPNFVQGNADVIERGMFLTLEMGSYQNFGVRIENDYYIGEKKEDLFSHLMPLDIENYILK